MLYLLYFYVPQTHLEIVKQALFKAGAGQVGKYECCAWQTKGIGQFMPKTGSNPFYGEQNKLEQVEEYKVEMICKHPLITQVITALRQSHPYEEPAFGIIKLEK